jgi:hypothetical protein
MWTPHRGSSEWPRASTTARAPGPATTANRLPLQLRDIELSARPMLREPRQVAAHGADPQSRAQLVEAPHSLAGRNRRSVQKQRFKIAPIQASGHGHVP